MTANIRRLTDSTLLVIHDFYLSETGRAFAWSMARPVLAEAGIELHDLDWGQAIEI